MIECGVAFDDDDQDQDMLVYELEDWEPAERDALDALLAERGIHHTWEGTDLVTSGAAEEEVDALLDSLEFPDALGADEDDEDGDGTAGGESGYQVMSDLFVAADRVAGERTVEASLAAELAEAAMAAVEIGAPYGVEDITWSRLQALAGDVVKAVEADADDATVVELAGGLRNVLRTLV